ncbi:MAG TPA: hypothetical protein VJR58_16775 [Vineibacter sp.]|nr:hypothetical protein [Vineibacter sp.]
MTSKPGYIAPFPPHHGSVPPGPPSPLETFVQNLAEVITVTPMGSLRITCGSSTVDIGPGGVFISAPMAIIIESGSNNIRMVGSTVSINSGALEVT